MSAQGSAHLETPGVLLARLTETAAKVQGDDLTELAQMHGWCEALSKTWRGASAERQPLADRVADLMQRLEKLILDDVEDSALAVAGITAQVTDLCRNYEPETEPAEPAGEQKSDPTPTPIAAEPQRAVPLPPPPADSSASGYKSTPLILNPKELDFVRGFVDEAGEHIEAIEAALLEVERTPEDAAKINDLFRPFHTIKGAAGFLNLTDVSSLTHEVETLLDQARKGLRPVTPGIIDLVFDVADIVKAQMAGIAAHLNDTSGNPVPQPAIGGMIAKLRAVVANQTDPQARTASGPTGLKTGEFLIEHDAVPTPVVDMALELKNQAPQRKTGEILMDMGAATARQVHQAIRSQTAGAPAAAPPPSTEPAPAAAPEAAPAASTGAAAGASANAVTDQSLRIDVGKLDALVDMVGELVIAQTLVSASPQVIGDVRLAKDVERVAKILRNLQEVTLAMRMVPIGATFQKMARLVRDVSRKAGKQVELVISGEDTELDKNVIQQIGDPLVHMVRNAIDHGVESPEARAAAGKGPVGRVHLGACHQAGNIIIEIRDDGKGLDAQKLIAKAIEKGLVQPGAELSEQEAFALIFAPGFSTAEKVTDISGRGVGMDVVKRNIDKLRGKIEITSVKGQGTTFYIRLPLTLAIIDGMIVRVGTQRFIIPTITLQQSLRPTPEQIITVQHRGEMIQSRGQLIPLIQLGQLFRYTGRTNPSEGMVVIANSDGSAVGLVVDELIGQQQVVIKSLGASFEGLRGISGAAILGDGRVGLILEITGLEALHGEVPTVTN